MTGPASSPVILGRGLEPPPPKSLRLLPSLPAPVAAVTALAARPLLAASPVSAATAVSASPSALAGSVRGLASRVVMARYTCRHSCLSQSLVLRAAEATACSALKPDWLLLGAPLETCASGGLRRCLGPCRRSSRGVLQPATAAAQPEPRPHAARPPCPTPGPGGDRTGATCSQHSRLMRLHAAAC